MYLYTIIMYMYHTMYLSFAKVEFAIYAEATLEHLKWEDLILVQERTNAGGRHIFYVTMVNEINFDLQQEAGRERDKGIEKEKERERERVVL